eukprot:gb/GEZN01010324.1/.p1 GENE.gb/GEZN01010324.1/~~gb/GEZN01010324.1/.p1  ORF type:complete len:279 (-),score=57.19 gb/GEZN01010324.1/:390-1226(-)
MAGKVSLDVTHSLISQRFIQQSFELKSTIADVKQKLYLITGTKPDFMHLSLSGVELLEGELLGNYNPQNGDVLHVADSDPFSVLKGLDDPSAAAKKYVMSDKDYSKRKDTVRSFKAEQLRRKKEGKNKEKKNAAQSNSTNANANTSSSSSIGVVNGESSGAAVSAANAQQSLEALRTSMPLGSRVKAYPGDRLGTVMWLGPVPEIPSPRGQHAIWLGVRFDEPVGTSDGSALGRRYFDAGGSNRGGFLDPTHVTVGDFPERDPFADSDEEEEDVMEEL